MGVRALLLVLVAHGASLTVCIKRSVSSLAFSLILLEAVCLLTGMFVWIMSTRRSTFVDLIRWNDIRSFKLLALVRAAAEIIWSSSVALLRVPLLLDAYIVDMFSMMLP